MEEEVDMIPDDEDSLTAERIAWERQSVFLLIKEYKKYRKEFNNPDVRKRIYWEKVCNNMSAQGHHFDVEQCEIKWRNLKKTFKENEGKEIITWPYYNALEDVFSPQTDSIKKKNVCSLLEDKIDVGEENCFTEDEDNADPPVWFSEFLNQYQEDEKKKMKMLDDMHQEVIELEKKKCLLLKSLIEKIT